MVLDNLMKQQLTNILNSGRDSALLRFSLAKSFAASGELPEAVRHLQEAVRQKPDYSAAWAELGLNLLRLGDNEGATAAWLKGITVATAQGDAQVRRQLEVRLRRMRSQLPKGSCNGPS
jgi:Flp pilus assembly protein TadD